MSINALNVQQPVAQKKSKPSSIGTKIGAGVGAAYCLTAGIKNRKMIPDAINLGNIHGLSKAKSIASLATGMAIGAAAIIGIGALIGKGIGKVVEHFQAKKKAPETV